MRLGIGHAPNPMTDFVAQARKSRASTELTFSRLPGVAFNSNVPLPVRCECSRLESGHAMKKLSSILVVLATLAVMLVVAGRALQGLPSPARGAAGIRQQAGMRAQQLDKAIRETDETMQGR